MTYKNIMKVIPIVQAASLAGHNVKFATKKDKDVGDFLKVGTTNIVGTELIKVEANLIGGL